MVRQPASLSIVEAKLLAIQAPGKLIRLAREHGPFINNEELVLAMKKADLEGYWYAIEIEYKMDNGEFMVSTYVARPGEHPYQFPSVSTVLDTLSGNPPTWLDLDCTEVNIDVLDESWIAGDPMKTVEDLQEIQLANHSRTADSPHLLGAHTSHARLH